MNYINYKMRTKIKTIAEKITKTFLNIMFFIPRYLYKNNPKFKSYIKNNEYKSYMKSQLKRLSTDLFRKLEKNERVLVLNAYDVLNDSFCDLADRNYKTLLEDEKWIEKNRLIVEKYLVKDYAAIFYKKIFEDEFMYKCHVNDHKNDDNIMYVVTKPK